MGKDLETATALWRKYVLENRLLILMEDHHSLNEQMASLEVIDYGYSNFRAEKDGLILNVSSALVIDNGIYVSYESSEDYSIKDSIHLSPRIPEGWFSFFKGFIDIIRALHPKGEF